MHPGKNIVDLVKKYLFFEQNNAVKLKKLIELEFFCQFLCKYNFNGCPFYEIFCEFLQFSLHSKGQLGFFTEITEILKVR